MKQYNYLLVILIIALVFACSKSYGDERTPLHVGANFVGTLAVYQFLNLMGKAGCNPEYRSCENKKEMLLLAAPLLFATGFLMEAAQARERKAPLDAGDVGANALGVGLAVGAVFAFDL